MRMDGGGRTPTRRCEVCKESAPVVYDVERAYGSKVNFVMLNIDNTKWWGCFRGAAEGRLSLSLDLSSKDCSVRILR